MWVAMVVLTFIVLLVNSVRLANTAINRRRINRRSWNVDKHRYTQIFDVLWLSIFAYITASMFYAKSWFLGCLCVLVIAVGVTAIVLVNYYLYRSEQHEQNS